MKLKSINRDPVACTRERTGDLAKVARNLDPALHPLQRATEYTRALAAAKLSRVFAKPFVSALSGHSDGLTCLARHPSLVNVLLSGAADGGLLLWDVAGARATAALRGHTRAVHGCACAPDGRGAVSAGDDLELRLWRLPDAAEAGPAAAASRTPPQLPAAATYVGRGGFRDVDHHWRRAQFASAGAAGVQLWDHERSAPVSAFAWGSDTVSAVRFNPSEPDLFASCGSDRRCAPFRGPPLSAPALTGVAAWCCTTSGQTRRCASS